MKSLFLLLGLTLGVCFIVKADPNSGPYPVPGGGGSGGGVTTNQLVPIQFTVGINTNDASPPSSTTQFAWFTGTNNQYGAANAEPTAFSTPSAGSTNVMGIDSNGKPVLLNAGGWGAGGGGSITNSINGQLSQGGTIIAGSVDRYVPPSSGMCILSAGGGNYSSTHALQPDGPWNILSFSIDASQASLAIPVNATNVLWYSIYTNGVDDTLTHCTNLFWSGLAATNYVFSPPVTIPGGTNTWALHFSNQPQPGGWPTNGYATLFSAWKIVGYK